MDIGSIASEHETRERKLSEHKMTSGSAVKALEIRAVIYGPTHPARSADGERVRARDKRRSRGKTRPGAGRNRHVAATGGRATTTGQDEWGSRGKSWGGWRGGCREEPGEEKRRPST